jgi:AraC-like DNA-binding protein
VAISDTEFSTQGFGLRKTGDEIADGRICRVASRQGDKGKGLLGKRANCEHVFLRIPPEALNRKLVALLGNPPSHPFAWSGKYDEAALARQYSLLGFVIAEIDQSPKVLPQILLHEFEQTLIIAYLCANVSNYSDLLNGKSPHVGPWQVNRAIDYIEANWEQALTVEALAAATGTSVRSLFATFRKARGCSPMAYARHVRLSHARELLSQATPSTSVASVASRCGFQNQGHFAQRYLVRFGELPSATLKRSKGRASQFGGEP